MQPNDCRHVFGGENAKNAGPVPHVVSRRDTCWVAHLLFMTRTGLGWQAQMWVTMIPTIIYAVLFFGKTFPKPQLEEANSLAENFKGNVKPGLYLPVLLHGALRLFRSLVPANG